MFSNLSLKPADEPVLYTAVATFALEAAIAFGAPIDPAQKTALMALIGAVAALFARSKVYPATQVEPIPTTPLVTPTSAAQ